MSYFIKWCGRILKIWCLWLLNWHNHNNKPPLQLRLEQEHWLIYLPQHSSGYLAIFLPLCISLSLFPFAAISNKRWLIWQAPWWLLAQRRYHMLSGRWRQALLSYGDVAKWVSLSKCTQWLRIRLIEPHADCPEPNSAKSYWSLASCLCHIWLSMINAAPAL